MAQDFFSASSRISSARLTMPLLWALVDGFVWFEVIFQIHQFAYFVNRIVRAAIRHLKTSAWRQECSRRSRIERRLLETYWIGTPWWCGSFAKRGCPSGRSARSEAHDDSRWKRKQFSWSSSDHILRWFLFLDFESFKASFRNYASLQRAFWLSRLQWSSSTYLRSNPSRGGIYVVWAKLFWVTCAFTFFHDIHFTVLILLVKRPTLLKALSCT